MKALAPEIPTGASPASVLAAGGPVSNSAAHADGPQGLAPAGISPALAAAAPALLEACLKMLKLTGGSQYWTGDTQEALERMEEAVGELRIADCDSRLGDSRLGEKSAVPWGQKSVAPRGQLRIGSEAAPQPIAACAAASAVLPEILSSVPVSMGRGLQMGGIEAERWRK